jgi:hypothetical protein
MVSYFSHWSTEDEISNQLFRYCHADESERLAVQQLQGKYPGPPASLQRRLFMQIKIIVQLHWQFHPMQRVEQRLGMQALTRHPQPRGACTDMRVRMTRIARCTQFQKCKF